MRSIYQEMREAIISYLVDRDGEGCAVCGLPIAEGFLELDHIIELQSGGKSRLDNYRLAHRKCNKHGKARRPVVTYTEGKCGCCGNLLTTKQFVWCSPRCATAGRVRRFRARLRADE